MAKRSRGTFKGRVEQRRADALQRQEVRNGLSPAEQLGLLDARLGKGLGAQKERARLAAAAMPNMSLKACAETVSQQKEKRS